MSNGTILLWAVGLIYLAAFLMFSAKWIEQGVSYIKRRRRVSRPRVVCRLRVGR